MEGLEGAQAQTGGNAPEAQPRVFDQNVLSQLNALGVDPNDSAQMSSLGFDMGGEKASDDATLKDNNSIDHLQGQSSQEGEAQSSTEAPAQAPNVESGSEAAGEADGGPSIDHPMFGGKKVFGGQKEEPAPSLEGIDSVNKHISEKFDGVENLDSLMTRYGKMSDEITELKVIQGEYSKIEKSFSEMPSELLKAIDMAEKGENWKEMLTNSPRLSFDSDVDSIDKVELVKAYYGDQFSDADFEAANEDSEDYDPAVGRLVNMAHNNAKEKFASDKSKNTLTLEQANNARTAKQTAFNESVDGSLASIKKFMPDATDEYLSSISQDLLQNKKDSLFSNQDGTLKEDAALRYALAKDGPEIFGQLFEALQAKIKTEANQELLERKSQTPPQGTAAPKGQNGIRKGFEKWVESL